MHILISGGKAVAYQFEAAPTLAEEPAQALQVHTLANAVRQHCKGYVCQQIQL